jgi:hypothetical protein
MVGLGRLCQINARLKQAKPEAAELPFCGITILFAGDLWQLPPVGDYALSTQKKVERGSISREESYTECLMMQPTAKDLKCDNKEQKINILESSLKDWPQESSHCPIGKNGPVMI